MIELTNKNATPRTKALYALIQSLQGNKIMTAQQECPSRMRCDQENNYILEHTGKLPLIRGLDYIHNDYAGVNARAKEWDAKGGIVSICWHTGVEGIGYPESQAENPDFEQLLTPGTPLNTLWASRMEATAKALLELQQQDIPVIWRPFHEFEGAWFWWGKGGPEKFKKLWRLMYDVFTHQYGLNNLIWILGYADYVPGGWYPGDDVCDILGSDTYKGCTTHAASYRRLKAINSEKPLAFHETGLLPAVDDLFAEAPWGWLMPWHSKWLMQDNPIERLNEFYHDPRVLTLGDLPRF